MACTQTLSGIVRDCEANVGGVRAFYAANFDDIQEKLLDATEEKIKGITMAEGKKFAAFYFKTGQASMEITPQFNDAQEYAGEQPVITLNFGRMDTTKRVQINALSLAELAVIILDNNGKYWLVGYDRPVLRTGGNATTGTARTDRNQYSVELTGDDNQLPYEIDSAAIEAILG